MDFLFQSQYNFQCWVIKNVGVRGQDDTHASSVVSQAGMGAFREITMTNTKARIH